MPGPTTLSVSLDRTHYSRYDPAVAVIHATVTPDPTTGLTGNLVVDLRRQVESGADAILEDVTIALQSGSNYAAGIAVGFDLSAIVDAQGFSTVRRSAEVGDYHVVATVGAVSGSASLTITPITAEAMRTRWLLGLPLSTAESLRVRLQPQLVTGVVVLDVAREHLLGAYALVYVPEVTSPPEDVAPASLAWNGGAAVPLPASGSYVLADLTGMYLVVSVELPSLPVGAVTEPLVVDYGAMSDETILREVLGACATLEDQLQGLRLEPTVVVSPVYGDADMAPQIQVMPPYWDAVGAAPSYYKPADLMSWISVKLPWRGLLKLHTLSGWFNRTKTVDIGKDWIVSDEKSGLVQLVPSNLAAINWIFYGAGFYTFFVNYQHVPNFWQYHATVGLRAMPLGIREHIARRAAMTLLAQAGQARWPGGITSLSIGRDGVSEGRGLNAQGVYAATIMRYAEESGLVGGQDLGVAKLRAKYVGIVFITL
jgi:hypothetical protein